MTAYAAPLPHYRFVLEQLCGADGQTAPAEWGEFTLDDAMAVLTEADRFAREILVPINQSGDREGAHLSADGVKTPEGFRDAYSAFRNGGWCAASAPESCGGQALPHTVCTLLRETWNAANLAFALCPLLTESAVTLLSEHGDEIQKTRWLPKLVSGDWTGAMAITEAQAGSDIGAIKCRAEPDGGRYRLYGQKIFISWGDHDLTENIVHLVLARLPDAADGSRGLSLFLVPKFLLDENGNLAARNDMRAIAIEEKLGIHASPTCTMAYGDAEGAVGWIVGQPGQGLAVMFAMMNAARLAVGHQGIGIAERAFQAARAYAEERKQGKSRAISPKSGERSALIDHPEVSRMLTGMEARIGAMRLLAAEVSGLRDRADNTDDTMAKDGIDRRLSLLTPVVKSWCTDEAVKTASEAIQVYGGAGYIEESGVAQHFRDARILPIYEGTNGIQAIDLMFRRIVADQGGALRLLIDDLHKEIEAAEKAAGGAIYTPIHIGSAQRALATLERCLDRILENDDDSAREYNAVPFLEVVAIAVCSCLCLRALARTEIEPPQNSDRLQTLYHFLVTAPLKTLVSEAHLAGTMGGSG